jgi:transcriptional regulator with XRE-family HTH domain
MITIHHYGPLFARIRRDRNIKASTVARHLGISEATYSQIETGRRSVSLERLGRICEELNLSTVDFVKLWQKQAVIRHKTKRTGRKQNDKKTIAPNACESICNG